MTLSHPKNQSILLRIAIYNLEFWNLNRIADKQVKLSNRDLNRRIFIKRGLPPRDSRKLPIDRRFQLINCKKITFTRLLLTLTRV